MAVMSQDTAAVATSDGVSGPGIAAEYMYLRDLRRQQRISELAARVRTLRDHGWEMTAIASGLALSRQRLYQMLNEHPNSRPPVDAPAITDLRSDDHGLTMRADPATVPPALCDPLKAMWAYVFRDKSAGTSPVSKLLDVTISLLTRRGVPYVRIANCGGVTHRAASERIRRAVERGSLPSELQTAFLSLPGRSRARPRTTTEASDPSRMFAVVQIVSASFPRFYTVRDTALSDRLFTFDALRAFPPRLERAGLANCKVVTEEKAWVEAIAVAAPDVSTLYAVPVQWLYTTAAAGASVFNSAHFDPVSGFYPRGLRPAEEMLQFITSPKVLLRAADVPQWGEKLDSKAAS